MKPYYQDKTRTIYCGDCLDVLPQLPEVDAIVTDPPYGWSFMGKKWDYDVPAVEVWQKCLGLLKPGSHTLVCCGTRTQHRMAVNIEDAGFEIRDLVAWIYGSGFPKSLDIGKAVDKIQGNEREIVGRGQCGYQVSISKTRHEQGYRPNLTNATKEFDLTKGNSPYEGWGTALKPAMELWTLARKPLEGTVAENVLKHGTGGLNIDGCRISIDKNTEPPVGDAYYLKKGLDYPNQGKSSSKIMGRPSNRLGISMLNGRFPANLIHDGSEEVVRLFPESIGAARQHFNPTHIYKGQSFHQSGTILERDYEGYNDNGSAARFFYCAKASKAERNRGLEGLEATQPDPSRKEGNPGGDNPRNRGVNKVKNYHPTVKPVSLMRYLCRLITPPNGIVLDPFMGTGSTGIACKLEGFRFIGIEIDEGYCEIASRRFPQEVLELV